MTLTRWDGDYGFMRRSGSGQITGCGCEMLWAVWQWPRISAAMGSEGDGLSEEEHMTVKKMKHSPPTLMISFRQLRLLVLVALAAAASLCFVVYSLYEPHLHVDLVFYDRHWVASEIHPVSPLSGCFNPDRVSPLYNVSDALYGKKQFEVQAGVPMRMGMDCYVFASLTACLFFKSCHHR